jgi:hypothetical protein
VGLAVLALLITTTPEIISANPANIARIIVNAFGL